MIHVETLEAELENFEISQAKKEAERNMEILNKMSQWKSIDDIDMSISLDEMLDAIVSAQDIFSMNHEAATSVEAMSNMIQNSKMEEKRRRLL